MADVAKYELISPSSNGGPSSLFLDLKRPFKTRRSLALLSGFFFIFVSFTLLLTFAPSFSPLFNNPFSSDSSNSSSPSPSTSSRSDFPSLSSYYFPDSAPRSPIPAALPPPLTTTTTPIPSPPPPPPPSLHRNESTTPTPIPSPPPPLRRNESSAAFAAPVRLNSTANSGVVALAVKSNFTSASSEKQDGGGGGSNATSPAPTPAKKGDLLGSMVSCDLYDGEWVRDDSYPLYKPGSCKLIDEQFNCFANGRPDHAYYKYKWKPRGCTIPRLNGGHLLKLLRGKRVVFVGDSLNRNMWESLICILRSSVKNPKNVFEAHGNLHFRTEAAYSFLFKDYNFTLEFFASPFLVRQWEVKGKDGKTKETLRIDMIAESANKFKTADILIFNTGHWWTHWKTSSGKDYYQEGSHVYNDLNVAEAYRRAITTWARWVDANVDPSKTHVLFRGYSNSHFSGGQWNSGGACDNETEPIKNTAYLTEYPWKDKVVESILKQMKTRVSYLNVTRITDYRKDGHPSIYRKLHVPEEERKAPMQYQDCSHWCLPGVPDSWNELLYAELIRRQYKQQKHITL